MPFCELYLEQNKKEITAILNNKQDTLTAFPLKLNEMIVIKRRIYQKPQCNIICTEAESLLVQASGNAGTIQPGTTVGDAKRNFFNDEDQDGFSWDDTEKN